MINFIEVQRFFFFFDVLFICGGGKPNDPSLNIKINNVLYPINDKKNNNIKYLKYICCGGPTIEN